MQGTPSIDVRIDPDLPGEPGAPVARVPFDAVGADVVVAPGSKRPPRVRREAVVRVGAAGPGWDEVPVDLAVTAEELGRDATGLVQRARLRRLALRPHPEDPDADVLGAISALTRADARIVRAGDAPALGPVVRATRGGTVTASSADEITARFGDLGLDALVARALGPSDDDGALVITVPRDGAVWLAREEATLRGALEAMALRRAEQRVRAVEARAEETASLLRRLLSVGGHDLSNLLFAAHLAVAAVQRQVGLTPPVEKLARSITGAVKLVRRVVDTGTEILDGGPPTDGVSDLPSVFARVRDQVVHDHPGRVVDGAVPELEVAVSDVVLEKLLTVVLSNAALHSRGPVTVRGRLEDDGVTVEVRNEGKLPFDDLRRLRPFEHRSNRSLGAGLWTARRWVDELPGVELTVGSDADGVTAVLRLPIAASASSYDPA